MSADITLRWGEAGLRASCGVTLRGERGLWPQFAEPTGGRVRVPGLGEGTLERSTFAGNGIHVQREVFRGDDEDGRLAVRLRVRNHRDTAVALERLTPLYVDGPDLRLGEHVAGDWVYVRQPRYKNDMPASTRLGSCAPGILDAVRGTRETGGWDAVTADEELPRSFVGSELTLLRSPGAGILVGVLPLDQQLVRSCVTLHSDRRRLASLRLDCLCDGQLLQPGEEVESQWVLVDLGEDLFAAVEHYVQALGAATGAPRPPAGDVPARPTVWCSWYYYANAFNQGEAEANLAALEQCPLPFDVFQIDECWDVEFGDWYPNSDWPDLAGLARRCRAAGYVPGLWTCGFLLAPRSRTRFHHPEWLLRKRSGQPVQFAMAGMQNSVLDTTHPGALRFIEELYRRLTREYGFSYHKVDFTRAVVYDPGTVFHDPSRNRAQAYRMGIEAIRRGIGDDAYLNICGGLYGPILGLVDAQRSGADVKSIWPQAPKGEESQGYGPFTIKQNTLRYWWNQLWDNDPDALMVRRRTQAYRDQPLALGLMDDAEALTSTLNQYLGGGLVCSTENLTEIESDRLLLLRHCAPSVGAAAVPRDLFLGHRFPAVFDTAVPSPADGLPAWHTISVVNWFDEPRSFTLHLDTELVGALADAGPRFLLSSFSGGFTAEVGRGETFTVGPVLPHACEVIKVQAVSAGAPCLLRTDGHFSMGGVEISTWEPGAEGLRFTVTWRWPCALRLEIRPPAGRAFQGSDVDAGAVVTVSGPAAHEEIALSYA